MPLALYNVRLLCVFTGFVFAFSGVGVWLHQLQVDRHEELYGKARAIYTHTERRYGTRGAIRDVRGNLLAGNEHCKDILIEPRQIPPARRDDVLQRLSRYLQVPEATLQRRFSGAQVEVVVKRGVSLRRAEALQNQGIPGIRLIQSHRRFYPKGSLAAPLLGFTNEKNAGAYGMEQICDSFLRPRDGSVLYMRSRRGRQLYFAERRERSALDGRDVYLTIDEPLQHIVEEELAQLHKQFAPQYSYAIMADPASGAILAMAQLPSFDPNDRSRMDPKQWRNHMVSDVYHPGSAMKGISICGALEYGVVDLDDVFYCEKGLWWYGGKPLRDSGHHYKDLTVLEIVQKSSNIGTAKVTMRLGEVRFYQSLRRFGFGARTGIELPFESRGLLPPVKKWDKLSITRFPMGQGLAVTPLQMVQAYSAIANRGRMMQLFLIDRVVDPRTGRTIDRTMPRLKRMATTPRAAAKITRALKQVTREGGTATRAAVPGFATAGKTGTSQKLVNGTYEGHRKYVASFVGFVPADDPAFVLIVVADEPDASLGYYGGTVCGPTFKRISMRALRYLNVQPVVAIGEGMP